MRLYPDTAARETLARKRAGGGHGDGGGGGPPFPLDVLAAIGGLIWAGVKWLRRKLSNEKRVF